MGHDPILKQGHNLRGNTPRQLQRGDLQLCRYRNCLYTRWLSYKCPRSSIIIIIWIVLNDHGPFQRI